MTTASLSRRERDALCDLALTLGEAAPTLCGDWTAKELITHLVVRERSLLGAPGIVVPLLAPLTDREMARVGRRDFAALVERLRSPFLTVYAVPLVDRFANTLEFFVHHEDLRRAQAGWEPRPLSAADQSTLWAAIRVPGRGLVRPAGVPVAIRRSDTGATNTLREGEGQVIVSGPPAELVLFLYGRARTRDLEFDGPQKSVARLRKARLGV